MKFPTFLISLLGLLAVPAFADVYIPPQSPQAAITRAAHNTPVEASIYNGSLRVVNGRPTITNVGQFQRHYGSATATNNTVTAAKTNPVILTDPYGNKARGSINTQTNMGSTSAFNKAASVYMGAAVSASVLNSSHATEAAAELGRGNYGSAAAHAAASFDFLGIGSGLNNLVAAYNAGKSESMHNTVSAAAQQKAQAAAERDQAAAAAAALNRQEAMNKAAAGETVWALYGHSFEKQTPVPMGVFLSSKTKPYAAAMFSYEGSKDPYGNSNPNVGRLYLQTHGDPAMKAYAPDYVPPHADGSGAWYHLDWRNVGPQTIAKMDIPAPPATLEDYLLNQQELTAIIADYLARNLEQNAELAAAIANMMWNANGGLNPDNTQTQVTGTPSDNTFLTAPYTPNGSNQAQQTQFIINPDGTVSMSTVPRPDLAAHTSQAPTRSPVVTNSTTTDTSTQQQNPPEQKDLCELHPDSLACATIEEEGYEDLDLPTEEEKVEFEPTCDFAQGIRPFVVLLAIVIAMLMAYSAVKEI